MLINVSGVKGFVPGSSIEQYSEKRLQKVIKLLGEENIAEIKVLCKVYKEFQKVEITISLSKNNIIRAEVSDKDIYSAIDLSIDKLVRQINKNREKLQSHLKKQGLNMTFNQDLDLEKLEKEVIASQLIKNKKVKLEPLTIDDAIMQMEILDHDFFIFINADTKKHNVVYRREDGNYAVIETE